MMSLSRFLCLSLAVAVLATGCGKKKTEQVPQETSVAADSTKKDSSDVFDEFFQDDKKAEKAKPAPTDVQFAEDGRFVVQVSCVGSQALADELVAKLQGKGWPAYVAQVQNPTPELPGTYYRVRIGGFYGVTPARSFGDNVLVPEGFDFWVDNRSNDNVGIESYGLGGSAPASSDYGSSSSTSSYGSTDASSSSASTSTTDWGSSSSSTSSSTSTSSTTDWGTSSTTPATTTESTTPATTESTTPATTTTTTEPAATTTPATTTTETGTSTGSSTSGTGTGTTKSGDWGGDEWGSDW
jgi:hypothetical protein